MIGNVKQTIEQRHLHLWIKEAQQRIGIAHAIPQTVNISELSHTGVPGRIFIIDPQIAWHTEQASEQRVEERCLLMRASLHQNAAQRMRPYRPGFLVNRLKRFFLCFTNDTGSGLGNTHIRDTHAHLDDLLLTKARNRLTLGCRRDKALQETVPICHDPLRSRH